jgi:dolichyl-phosphate-mannose--protein O-mannosyl transferase
VVRGSPAASYRDAMSPLTIYGVVVLTFMMVMYALERHDRRYVLGFALGCALSSSYGFASGAWPFGVVEGMWCLIAVHRFSRGPTVASAPK